MKQAKKVNHKTRRTTNGEFSGSTPNTHTQPPVSRTDGESHGGKHTLATNIATNINDGDIWGLFAEVHGIITTPEASLVGCNLAGSFQVPMNCSNTQTTSRR
jgi:hypothetical protein